MCFMQKIGKTYSNSVTFLPSKELLLQIVKCESLEKYFESRSLEQITKQELIARILVGDQNTGESQDKVKINKNPDSHLLKSCSVSYLDSQQHEEDLLL